MCVKDTERPLWCHCTRAMSMANKWQMHAQSTCDFDAAGGSQITTLWLSTD